MSVEVNASDSVSIAERLQQPETQAMLHRLLDHAEQLDKVMQLTAELPNLLAIATDVLDEWATKLKADGIDLEQSLRNGLHAALYLGAQVRQEEIDRLGYLLRSDVLSEHTVETVGMAGAALSSCRRGVCDQPVPERIGLFGLMSALRDPSTQRALSFAVQFGKCFGRVLEERHPNKTGCDL